MKKATIGLIGAGGIAQSQHIPNLLKAPHTFLKTICDVERQKLQKVRTDYSIPHETTGFLLVLADPEIDAVVVATKADAQADITMAALKAGKHVYVEKPLAETVESCERVVDVQKKSGKHVAVGFNRRFAPAYVQAREILHRHGGPKSIYYRISDELWLWGKGLLEPGTRYIHEVCHVFDVLRWLTDSDVTSIYCVQARPDEDIAVLEFSSGCIATILSSGYATMDMTKERLEVIAGDKGGVIVEEFVELRTYGFNDCQPVYRYPGHTHPKGEFLYRYLFEKGGAAALYDVRRTGWELREKAKTLNDEQPPIDRREILSMDRVAPSWNYMVDKGWVWAIDHFAESILTGQTPRNATARDGLQAALLAQAAIQSRDTHSVVHLE